MKKMINQKLIYLTLTICLIFALVYNPAIAKSTLTLAECIELAKQHSTTLSISEAEIQKAQWRLKELKTNKLPALNYDFTSSYLESIPNNEVTEKDEHKLTFSLPIYTGGRLENLIQAATFDLKHKELENTIIRLQLISDVTTAYFNLLQAKNALILAEESLKQIIEHQTQVQIRYEHGNAAKIDLIRLDIELAENQQTQIKAKTAYQIEIAKLNYLLGKPITESTTIKEESEFTEEKKSLTYYQDQAKNNRPEIAQANLKLRIIANQLNIIKSNYYPSLTFQTIYSRNDQDFLGTSNNNEHWSANFILSWNLFNSGQTNAQVNQVTAELSQAELNLKAVDEQIQLEVYHAYLEMLEAEKIIETTKIALDKAEEEYQIIRFTYEKGFETSFNVLNIQVKLTETKTYYLNALHDLNISKIKLLKATGVLLQE